MTWCWTSPCGCRAATCTPPARSAGITWPTAGASTPWDLPCAGSYFKNLPPESPGGRRRAAGRLLEQIGAKEMREGGAQVFAKHANIIVNHGQARSVDVLRLAARMKDAVHDRFGELLEEEVRHLATPDASLSQTSE